MHDHGGAGPAPAATVGATPEREWGNAPWVLAAVLVLGTLVLGWVPAFSVTSSLYVDGGDDPVRTVTRTFSLYGFGDHRHVGVPVVLAVASLLAVAGRRRFRWAAPGALLGGAVVALCLVRRSIETHTEENAVLDRAVHKIFAESGLDGGGAYATTDTVSRQIGYVLPQVLLGALLVVGGLALGRVLDGRGIGLIVAMTIPDAAFLVGVVPGSGSHYPQPSGNPWGLLAVNAGWACAAIGAGALTRRRSRAALVALCSGPLVALGAEMILWIKTND